MILLIIVVYLKLTIVRYFLKYLVIFT